MDLLSSMGIPPAAVIGFLVAVAVFTTFVTLAMPLMAGNTLKTRMKAVALEREQVRARERARLSAERDTVRNSLKQTENGFAAKVVHTLDLKRALADEKTINALRVAGYRSKNALTLFLFSRLALAVLFFVLSLAYVFGAGVMMESAFVIRVAVCLVAAYLGLYAPLLFVSNVAKKRAQSITRAWPDALDLLLICVESGNSIEAAFRRVAEEIGLQSVPLAEELVLLTAELSYLPDRRVAYDNLAKRTNLDTVRSVCMALIQAERYGTPLGTALRTLSQENRDARMNIAEKKAAALPPKLTVPMIVFFLPVLFAVIIGPAIIQAMGLG